MPGCGCSGPLVTEVAQELQQRALESTGSRGWSLSTGGSLGEISMGKYRKIMDHPWEIHMKNGGLLGLKLKYLGFVEPRLILDGKFTRDESCLGIVQKSQQGVFKPIQVAEMMQGCSNLLL